MGTSKVEFRELRFLIEPKYTKVFVLIKDLTPIETPIGVAGWHSKIFIGTKSILDILNQMREKDDDPIMWVMEAPE